MARKATKAPPPPTQEPVEISTSDREALTEAYRSGLIQAWKRDGERGYRLTFAGRVDEYVEVPKLTSYLGKIKAAS
jgi:hypothetical protein